VELRARRADRLGRSSDRLPPGRTTCARTRSTPAPQARCPGPPNCPRARMRRPTGDTPMPCSLPHWPGTAQRQTPVPARDTRSASTSSRKARTLRLVGREYREYRPEAKAGQPPRAIVHLHVANSGAPASPTRAPASGAGDVRARLDEQQKPLSAEPSSLSFPGESRSAGSAGTGPGARDKQAPTAGKARVTRVVKLADGPGDQHEYGAAVWTLLLCQKSGRACCALSWPLAGCSAAQSGGLGQGLLSASPSWTFGVPRLT
jgi:hypothetical protein